MYYIKRIIRRILGNAVQDEVERRGRSYLDGTTEKITGQTDQSAISSSGISQSSAAGTGAPRTAAFMGFDPLASTKEQFYVSWPIMPIEVKQQMMNDPNSFGKLPENLKHKLLTITRTEGQDSAATNEEKKIIDEAFDYLTK